MTTLKGLIEKFGNTLTDMQIIKEWFTRNNQEAEGLKLVSKLAQSQLNKVERKYDYARTWIPVKVDMRDVCQDKDVGEKLNKLIDYQILGVPIPDHYQGLETVDYCEYNDGDCSLKGCKELRNLYQIKRPSQSWCYVEDYSNEKQYLQENDPRG